MSRFTTTMSYPTSSTLMHQRDPNYPTTMGPSLEDLPLCILKENITAKCAFNLFLFILFMISQFIFYYIYNLRNNQLNTSLQKSTVDSVKPIQQGYQELHKLLSELSVKDSNVKNRYAKINNEHFNFEQSPV